MATFPHASDTDLTPDDIQELLDEVPHLIDRVHVVSKKDPVVSILLLQIAAREIQNQTSMGEPDFQEIDNAAKEVHAELTQALEAAEKQEKPYGNA